MGVDYQKSSQHEEAIDAFKKCLHIYQSTEKYQLAGNCLIKIGNSHYLQGNYQIAILYYDKALNAYLNVSYAEGIANVTNNLGAIYYYLGDFPKALERYKQALQIQEELGNTKIAEATTHNIGGIYFKIGDYKKAKQYFDKALGIARELEDSVEIAKILNNIGMIFIQQKDFEQALKKLTLSQQIAEKIDSKDVQLAVLSSLGDLFYQQNQLIESLKYHHKALKLSIKVNNRQSRSNSLTNIGTIFYNQQRYHDAINNCKEGLTIAEEIGSISLQKDACDCLHQGYKFLGNSERALYFYEKYIAFKDSLRAGETSNKMLSMEFQNQQLTDSIAFVKKQHATTLRHTEEIKRKENQRNIGLISLIFILIVAAGLWNRLYFVRKSKKTIQIEKDISEKLLLNILPGEIASELKEKGKVSAKDFNPVSILFSDFKSFTQTAAKMTPHELVEEINTCFEAFDYIVEKHGIEKIKTIGDSYMAAGGIPVPNKHSLNHIVLAGLEMQAFMQQRLQENHLAGKPAFEMRVGIHAGPIVAGVVGIKKFQYDVWGDTVNTASRMESNGSVGKVNISENLYQLLKENEQFSFEYRGNIRVKGKGNMNMYFVEKTEKKLISNVISLARKEHDS